MSPRASADMLALVVGLVSFLLVVPLHMFGALLWLQLVPRPAPQPWGARALRRRLLGEAW